MGDEGPRILVLGVGNILFSDEGVGVRVVEELEQHFRVPGNVTLLDGGTLGIRLLGPMAESDYLIVVDAIRHGGEPGTIYRLAGPEIPERIRAKNSLHQLDLLESLTLCSALGNVPESVILGVEPEDMETMSLELTPTVRARVPELVERVCRELKALDAGVEKLR